MKILVFLLLAVTAGAEPRWFVADERGRAGSPLAQGPSPSGWSLERSGTNGNDDVTLFRDGSAVQRLRFRQGVPVWREDLDPATGRPTVETVYEQGAPLQVTTLSYEGSALVKRTTRDSRGTILWDDRLFYSPQGELRRLERRSDGQVTEQTAWTTDQQGRLSQVWNEDSKTMNAGDRRVWTYRPNGEDEVLETKKGVEWKKTTERHDDGTKTVTIVDFSDDHRTDDQYDSRGRLIEETQKVKDHVVSQRRWRYDAQGHLLEDSTLGPESAGQWTYHDNPDGTTTSVLRRDGVVVREETLRDGSRELVKLYDRGKLFMVETWSGGHKVKETFYENGVVVRERQP